MNHSLSLEFPDVMKLTFWGFLNFPYSWKEAVWNWNYLRFEMLI